MIMGDRNYQVSAKLTFEAIKYTDTIESLKKNILEKVAKETSTPETECFYYFTFQQEDYRQQLIRIVASNVAPDYLFASFPKKLIEAKKAINYLKKINSHLRLVYLTSGLDGNDFIFERISVKFGYQKI